MQQLRQILVFLTAFQSANAALGTSTSRIARQDAWRTTWVEAVDCIAVIEVEAADTHQTTSWGFGRENTGNIANWRGGGYYTWNGSNSMRRAASPMTFTVDVTTPGDYEIRIRNFHDNPDHTESNDCWLQVDDGAWVKIYSSGINSWTWQTVQDFGHGDHLSTPRFTWERNSRHKIEIGGRSNGFSIDRIHIFKRACADPDQILSLDLVPTPSTFPAVLTTTSAPLNPKWLTEEGCCIFENGGITTVLHETTKSECKNACKNDPLCLSIQYKRDEEECKLSTSDAVGSYNCDRAQCQKYMESPLRTSQNGATTIEMTTVEATTIEVTTVEATTMEVVTAETTADAVEDTTDSLDSTIYSSTVLDSLTESTVGKDSTVSEATTSQETTTMPGSSQTISHSYVLGFNKVGSGCCETPQAAYQIHGNIITRSACKALCEADINCEAVEFDRGTSMCSLYSDLAFGFRTCAKTFCLVYIRDVVTGQKSTTEATTQEDSTTPGDSTTQDDPASQSSAESSTEPATQSDSSKDPTTDTNIPSSTANIPATTTAAQAIGWVQVLPEAGCCSGVGTGYSSITQISRSECKAECENDVACKAVQYARNAEVCAFFNAIPLSTSTCKRTTCLAFYRAS